MDEENLPLSAPEEEVPVGGLLLAECERIISVLGEDGARPLPPAQLKKISDSAEKAADPFRPILLGDALIDWAEADSVSLHDLKDTIPIHEVIMASYINTLIGMGAGSLKRSMLATAGKDKRLLDAVDDGSTRAGIIASRLKSLNDYVERKQYALSLGVMAYQR